jgi:intracellular septation protein A
MALSPVTAPGRSVAGTLRIVELAVWGVLSAAVALLVATTLVGAFAVSGRSVDVPVALLLVVVVLGTITLVVAEIVFE